jgi:hypothetical protein
MLMLARAIVFGALTAILCAPALAPAAGFVPPADALEEQAAAGDAAAQHALAARYEAQSDSALAEGDIGRHQALLAIAVDWCRRAAEGGFLAAQIELGQRYADGRGVAQDLSEAVKWRLLAAKQGSALAQGLVGVMYYVGAGVAADDAEAMRWFGMAARQGVAEAQLFMGVMYDTGRGAPEDDAEAVRWYALAAAQGDGAAQYFLGEKHEAGEGVSRDVVEAYAWYALAAAQAEPQADRRMAALKARMSLAQIEQAERLIAQRGSGR